MLYDVLFVAVALGAIVLYPRLLNVAPAAATISVEEAHRKAASGDLVLVDVRTPAEWRETGIPASAEGITMGDPGLVGRVAELTGNDKSRAVAVICRSGSRSAGVQAQLLRSGFTNVANVGGGMAGGNGWIRAGLPVRRPEQPVRRT